jgi:D-arabinose 1-dehydrogenase-like Zn-dependent alcohol dehydrogenase
MKAAFFKEHGGSDKIIYGDYRDPVPQAGEAVVRVRACALNHVDMLLLDGRYPPPEGLPHVNGCEVTGTVEATGAGVAGLTKGQRVIVFPGFSCGTCEFCLRGERTVCLRYGYLGAAKDGGYAELRWRCSPRGTPSSRRPTCGPGRRSSCRRPAAASAARPSRSRGWSAPAS